MSVNVEAPSSRSVTPVARRRIGYQNPIWHLLPFIVFVIGCMIAPRFADEKEMTMLIYIGINAILAIGLNLLMGYAGQISLGHAAFFGLGAYTSAILTVRPIPIEVIPGFSVGLGVMVGTALLISLTRAAGWKLGAGVVLLIVLSWIVRAMHLHAVGFYGAYAVVMAVYAMLVKASWWKGVVTGLMTVLTGFYCFSSLQNVLAAGGASPWTGIVAGIVLTCVVAYLIGGQVLRLKGHYLAMATLGFGVIVEVVFRQWTAVTGGSSDGIVGIPAIHVMDSLPGFVRRALEFMVGHKLDGPQEYFYLVWGLVFVALLIAVNIVRSRVGRAMRAVHGSEIAAESLGVDTERYKVQVFVLSAGLASVAGSLYAHNAGIGYINPSEFGLMTSIQMVVMVVVGGMASVWGALIGAAAIQALKTWLITIERMDVRIFGMELKGLDPIVFGAVLIVIMIVLPQGVVRGLADLAGAAWRTIRKRKPVDAGRGS